MDFIPKVTNPAYPPIEVPFLEGIQYDDKGFQDFPARYSFDANRLHVGDFTEYTAERTEPFLQAWLYFGLLGDVLHVPWTEQDFTYRNSVGQKMVTCAKLPEYLVDWKKHLLQIDRSERWAELRNAAKTLTEVALIIQNALGRERGANLNLPLPLNAASRPMPLRMEIVLSIQILQSTIAHFHRRMQDEYIAGDVPLEVAYKKSEMMEMVYNAERIAVPPSVTRNPIIQRRLRDAGWCRNDIARTESLFTASTMYYASFFPRRANSVDHADCSEEECRQNNIDESEYVTRHVHDGCQCEFLHSPLEQIYEILDNDGIPLIFFDENAPEKIFTVSCFQDEQMSISVGLDNGPRAAPHATYIAISHVWSLGLGNANANALPTCQLRRIQGHANELIAREDRSPFGKTSRGRANVPFWIDTLCVPLEPRYRRLAIVSLTMTYQTADKVLVLDEEVEAFSESNSSVQENLMQLVSSSWMRRMWTLQEAVQARCLYVRFQDQSINIHKLYNQMVDDVRRIDYPYQAIRVELASFYRQIFYSTTRSIKQSERFSYAWDAAYYRSTTKSFDKLLVLAGLLDVDTKQLFDCTEEQAFKTIMNSVSYIPKGVAFLDSPRVGEKGCGWMALGFTKSQLNSDHSANMGQQTKNGLIFSSPGFVGVEAAAMLLPVFYILDVNTGRWCQILRRMSDTRTKATPEVETTTATAVDRAVFDNKIEISHGDVIKMTFAKKAPPSIVLEEANLLELSAPARGLLIETSPEHDLDATAGVLRTVVRVLPGHLRMDLEHSPLPDFEMIHQRCTKRKELGLPLINFGNVIVGKVVDGTQEWCIG